MANPNYPNNFYQNNQPYPMNNNFQNSQNYQPYQNYDPAQNNPQNYMQNSFQNNMNFNAPPPVNPVPFPQNNMNFPQQNYQVNNNQFQPPSNLDAYTTKRHLDDKKEDKKERALMSPSYYLNGGLSENGSLSIKRISSSRMDLRSESSFFYTSTKKKVKREEIQSNSESKRSKYYLHRNRKEENKDPAVPAVVAGGSILNKFNDQEERNSYGFLDSNDKRSNFMNSPASSKISNLTELFNFNENKENINFEPIQYQDPNLPSPIKQSSNIFNNQNPAYMSSDVNNNIQRIPSNQTYTNDFISSGSKNGEGIDFKNFNFDFSSAKKNN